MPDRVLLDRRRDHLAGTSDSLLIARRSGNLHGGTETRRLRDLAEQSAKHSSDLDDDDVSAAQGSEVIRVGGEDRDGARGGEGGGAEHGIDGVPVPVQADVGQERGGVAGDLFGDRFDDKTGQCPFQGRPVDAGGGPPRRGWRRR